MSGKKNSFTAVLHREGREKDVLYTIEGQWSESFLIKDGKTKHVIETYNAKGTPTTPLTVAPTEEQDPLESRRAWRQVAAAIQKGDMDTTGAEKSLIENQQRELRRKEQTEGREWDRRYFTRVSKDPVFDALAPKIGERSEPEKTGGIWRWDEKKYQAVLSGAYSSPSSNILSSKDAGSQQPLSSNADSSHPAPNATSTTSSNNAPSKTS